MNGSEPEKVVIDTNVLFMAFYNENSKAGKIIKFANQNKIKLYSPDSVKEELIRVLEREMDFSKEQINLMIESLPIIWIEKEFYEKFLSQTKVKHKPDKPIEALALLLNCEILSADEDFKNRLNINKLLDKLEDVS